MFGWNVGGAELSDLPKAIRDSVGWRVSKDDVVLLQEVPREGEGWQHQELEGKTSSLASLFDAVERDRPLV